MKLDNAQTQKVKEWIEQGLKLSEIQDKLSAEFGLRLGVQVKDKPKEAPVELKAGAAKPSAPQAPPAREPSDAIAGNVSVTVDQVTRPGALVSGKVKFSDGKSADWYLDQMGRLGLAPKEQGYKPSEADLMDFQAELQNELARLGF
jgi:hypothetical protein